MKYSFIFILLLLLIYSCSKNKPVTGIVNIPADSIIPRSQMVKMLADVHVLEAAMQVVKKKGTNEHQMAAFYYNQLFSGYHMSEKRFRTNLVNYQSDAEQFYTLYGDVMKELELRLKIQKSLKSKQK